MFIQSIRGTTPDQQFIIKRAVRILLHEYAISGSSHLVHTCPLYYGNDNTVCVAKQMQARGSTESKEFRAKEAKLC